MVLDVVVVEVVVLEVVVLEVVVLELVVLFVSVLFLLLLVYLRIRRDFTPDVFFELSCSSGWQSFYINNQLLLHRQRRVVVTNNLPDSFQMRSV